MARPVKRRRICAMPEYCEFAPTGRKASATVRLTLDEFEALRLIDHLGCSQAECAAQMNVARTTVQLIYDAARKKIADALVNGSNIRIEGGRYELCRSAADCCARRCGRRNAVCVCPDPHSGPGCGRRCNCTGVQKNKTGE